MGSPLVSFGREICGELAAAERREWLVTNGIGGYASGTVAGSLTRRQHGLLVAALRPPLGRTLLVSKFDEAAEYGGSSYPLSANRWQSGAVESGSCNQIEGFYLDGTAPVWHYACADALLEKRIWMPHGANTTCVRYSLARGSRRLKLQVKALINYRNFNSLTHADGWQMEIKPVEHGLRVTAFDGAVPFYLLSPNACVKQDHNWYRNFELSIERKRGFDSAEDHLLAGTFEVELGVGEFVVITASTEPQPNLDAGESWNAFSQRENELKEKLRFAHPGVEIPTWIEQLALAADQFAVNGPENQPGRCTVIAGYHWFGDWGRDTMISVPGLALTTGRPEIARDILSAWADLVNGGMLPNRFPESGDQPEYNTVDAALWYILAVWEYWRRVHDRDLLRRIYPALSDIVECYTKGTRYNIHADSSDGLLYAGESGIQLTWMDAKIGDWVVTPRTGKPIEVNALWLNALHAMTEIADVLKRPSDTYQRQSDQVLKSFGRFWNDSTGCCFDVLDGPSGNDASIRPNQTFAVSLPVSPFDDERQKCILDTVGRHLLTSYGLRSLSPGDPQYRRVYSGNSRARDSAYHQGTVWGWLLGRFVEAHLRVYKDTAAAKSLLEPISHHLLDCGLGTASEIFDGDAPFTPRGAIAQAWTVAEVLRAWEAVSRS